MKKDKSIQDLIDKLRRALNFDLLEIIDHWEADLCAIGFKKGNKLAYISTFSSINIDPLKYDFDLEIVNDHEKDKITIIKKGRNVSEEQLISELKKFLEP